MSGCCRQTRGALRQKAWSARGGSASKKSSRWVGRAWQGRAVWEGRGEGSGGDGVLAGRSWAANAPPAGAATLLLVVALGRPGPCNHCCLGFHNPTRPAPASCPSARPQAVEVGAGRKVFDLQLPDLGPYSLDFSRSGRHMLLAGRKGHLALMDWQRTRLICEVQVRGGSRGCKGCCCVVAAVVVTAVAAIAAAVRHCAVVC